MLFISEQTKKKEMDSTREMSKKYDKIKMSVLKKCLNEV